MGLLHQFLLMSVAGKSEDITSKTGIEHGKHTAPASCGSNQENAVTLARRHGIFSCISDL